MNPGYVYILTNPSMPGLVKVGRTSRDVDLRAEELWRHTGVPTPFDVYAREKTCDCIQLEAFIHGDLRKHRLSKSREFFRIDPDEAQKRLMFWAEYQASEFVRENFSSVTTVPYRTWVDQYHVEDLAKDTGLNEGLIARAMAMISTDELAPAIARVKAADRLEQIEVFQRIGIPQEEWEAC